MKRVDKMRIDDIDLFIDDRQDIRISQDILEDMSMAIREVLIYEGEDLDKEVSLSFVSNEEIRSLNKDYRSVDSVTDVLSFPLEDDFGLPMEERILGDIIISPERAQEQAEDYGHSLRRELVYLTVHSMFHLLGYDHMEDDEKKDMREREEDVMDKLNILR